MLSWRNRLAQDAYTIEVTGSSPVGSTKKLNTHRGEEQRLFTGLITQGLWVRIPPPLQISIKELKNVYLYVGWT